MTILKTNLLDEIEKQDWWDELEGRIIQQIRPGYFEGQGSKPHVRLQFKDGATFAILVREGVFFEGCLINTIRNPQEIDRITFNRKNKDHTVEVRAKTFPLFVLRATNRDIPGAQFPFQLFETENFDG